MNNNRNPYLAATLLLIALSIVGCKQNASKPLINQIQPERFDTIARNLFKSFKVKIDSDQAADTVKANICFMEPDSTSEEVDEDLAHVINGDIKAQARFFKKYSKTKKLPCKGTELSIPNFRRVSVISFGKEENVKILAQSFHDSGSPKDFSLLKFDSASYAYSLAHICGSLSFPYYSDTMRPLDLLKPMGRGENGETVGWITVPADWLNQKIGE
jgi:hypothetical protein